MALPSPACVEPTWCTRCTALLLAFVNVFFIMCWDVVFCLHSMLDVHAQAVEWHVAYYLLPPPSALSMLLHRCGCTH
jgi:hypothetical protein